MSDEERVASAAECSRARTWANKQWQRAQDDASARAAALEERVATDRSLSTDEYRERRAVGLARAREITSRRIDDGGLHIPLLLLTSAGSKEEYARILAGAPSEDEAARHAEKLAENADTRSAKEIIQTMHEEGRGPVEQSTALKTVAWPKSHESPPPVLMAGQKPSKNKSKYAHRERNNSARHSLSAATTE